MYFESRYEAGEQLAEVLFEHYRYEDCAVVALSDGGVLVGEPIAQKLHSLLMMLVTETIEIPGERLNFGSVSQNGNFTYDSNLSSFEIDEYTNEFSGYLQEEKRKAFQKINRIVGDGGTIDINLLVNRNIILISDGYDRNVSLEAALDFIKPAKIKKIIFATPVASVDVVNRLHILVDEMHILDVKPNYMGTDHYYDDNQIPSHEATIEKINHNVMNWQ